MTREVAIKGLKAFRKEFSGYEPNEEMFDMAIKALEQEPTTKNYLAQDRYQDLIEYFGDEKVAKTILESRKEFKAWLERLRWNTKKVGELARELEQLKSTTKNDSPKYCDRNICLKNEYNNVGCEDCEVTKSQEPTTKNDLGVDWDELKSKIFMEVDGGTDDTWLRYGDMKNVRAWMPLPKPYKAESVHDVVQEIVKNNGVVDL